MRISDWSSDVCSSDLHDRAPEVARSLREESARPSLYDEAIRLLARRGFAIDPAVTQRDLKQPYAHSRSVEAAWADISSDERRVGKERVSTCRSRWWQVH